MALADIPARIRLSLEGSQAVVRDLKTVERGFASAKSAMVAFAGGLSVAAFTAKIVEVQREFDVLNSSLITVTGSSQAAAREMEWIKKFAKETPFGLAQATQAFVKMKSLGLDPSREALTSYGNTASAMGKDLNQMIEAVADAATGQFERLREFGINASKQGDKVAFTFQGITTTVGKNAAEITRYLRQIGDVNFGSAMLERTKTLDGALSSLGDAWDGLLLKISQSGLGAAISGAVSTADKALTWLADNIDDIGAALVTGSMAVGAALLITNLGAIASAAVAAAGAMLKFALSMGAFGVATAAVVGLTAAYMVFKDEFDGTGEDAMRLGNMFAVAFDMITGKAQDAAAAVSEAASTSASEQGKAATSTVGFWERALRGIAAVLDMVASLTLGVCDGIAASFVAVGQIVRNAFAQAFNGIAAMAENTLNVIADKYNKLPFLPGKIRASQFGRMSTEGATSLSDVGNAFSQGMASNIRTNWSDTADAYIAAVKAKNAVDDLSKSAQAAGTSLSRAGEKGAKGLKKAKDEAMELFNRLQAKQAGVDPSYYADLQKLYSLYTQGRISLDDYRAAVTTLISEQKYAQDAARELKEEEDKLKKAREEHEKTVENQIKSAQEILANLEFETRLIGLNAAEREKASLMRELERQGIERGTVAWQQYAAAIGEALERKRAATDLQEAQKQMQEEWQRTTDDINKSLTDALLRGFEDGKGFAKNFRDTLKNMFRTLVLQPLIRPIVAWSGGMLSMLMGGMAGAAQGGAGGGLGNMGGFNFSGFGGMNNLGMLGSYGQMFANGATLLQQGWGAFSDNLAALWTNGQYGSAFASGAGAAMSALGGIFGGRAIGQALSGGYSAWGRSGNSAVNTGTAAGAAIGSFIPGVGTAIGALVGGALGGVVNRLFGRKLKDYGIEGTFGGEEGFSGRAWKYYKGGWFRSNKTRYEALDEETRQTLAKPYQAVRDQLRAYAEALNIPTDKLNSVTHTLRLSLQGLKPEEIQQRYTEALGAAQEALAESLLREAEGQQMERLARGLMENFTVKAQDAASQLQTRSYFRRDGETAVQTLERMAASLATVNSAFALLGRTLFEASVRSGDMASRLVELFGQGQEGRNAFTQAVGSYYQNFYSETERKENARRAITQQIQDLGLQAPDLQSANARAQFRALVDGLDLTTDAGRRAFAALMRLQGAVAEVTEAAEDATQAERRRAEALKEALDAAQKATDAALSALEKAIDRQIGSLQTALQAAQDLASEARSVMQTAHAAARQLYGQTGAGNAMLAAQGQAFIRNALTSARAGVLPDATELSRAIEAARGGLTMDNYATVAEYERDQLVMAGRLQEIGDKAGGQLTLAEQQVAHLKTQIDLLTQQKEYWREQIAAMRGQGETLRSIDQALDWLRQKMQAERAAQQAANGSATGQSGSTGGSGSGFGPGPATPAHTLSYDANTGRLDVGGGIYIDFRTGERHYADGSVGRLNRAELDLFRYRALERGIRIPQFASGGWHRGGLALVGEEGPELVHFAQPARIYNSADTRGMLAGDSGSSAEVAALRQDVAALRALLERIADASQRSADTLRNVTSETGGGAFAMMEVSG